jgi:photoactive yellow protein
MSMSSAAAVSTSFIQRAIHSISEKELDSLAYGVIQLDAEGVVLRYNAFEAGLSGLTQQKVVGKNFFTQVAPCTDLKKFHGRFREGVAGGKLQCTFRFHFAFKKDPRDVTVTLFYNQVDQTIWVLVQPSESNK